MKKENDEIVDLFRSRLENVELNVRNDLWDSLESEVPAILHRRRLILHRFAAAVSVLLVLAGASAAFWYLSPQEEIADAFTQVAISTTPPNATTGSDAVKVELPSINEAHVSPQPAPPKSGSPLAQVKEDESISVSFSMSFSFSATEGSNRGNQNQTTYVGGLKENTDSQINEEPQDQAVSREVKKEKPRKWSVGVMAATALGEKKNNIDYKMPLLLGITIQRDLSERVALESGLVYTQLKTETVSGEPAHKQTLHYMGIPIKANVSLHETNRLNLYASGGAMLEKCISGITDAYQASVSAGLGIEYKLNNRLSLYAEPGATYHFDNGSSVKTLRKERPLNMNLLCGVRMTY
ncbi:MAG: porin family protein [Bacteroides sp.]|nr:porin family protein [Bacteroides sp.]